MNKPGTEQPFSVDDGAVPAVFARAGGDFLDIYFSDSAGGGVGDCVQEPAGGCAAGGRDDAQLTQALAADKGLTAVTMDEAAGTHALATGQILLLAIQRPDGVAYKYDDTNPDARTARLLADRAVQTAAGRHDAVRPTTSWCMRRGRGISTLWCRDCWG
jgi:hypothetical protein